MNIQWQMAHQALSQETEFLRQRTADATVGNRGCPTAPLRSHVSRSAAAALAGGDVVAHRDRRETTVARRIIGVAGHGAETSGRPRGGAGQWSHERWPARGGAP